jgi:hypothetical protein
MRLAATQAKLWPAITERKGEGLGDLVDAGLRLTPQRRVDIYAQMYFWRQVDALKEDFPKLAFLLGDDAFAHMVEAYVREYPSEHPSLGRLGRKLALFLAEHRSPDSRSDLADLAALEWARAEVFVELDAAVAPVSVLAELAPDRFAAARLRLVPAMRVLRLQHDAMAPWRAIENNQPVPEPSSHGQHLLVWRKGWAVYHAPIDADEAQALHWAGEGRNLGGICEAFSGRDEPAAAAFAALQSWLAESLVAEVDPR